MKTTRLYKIVILLILSVTLKLAAQNGSVTYPIVDTGQEIYFSDWSEINVPEQGESFFGQDAQYNINQPSYTDNGDGTITDNITGLMWFKSPDLNGDGNIDVDDKLSYEDALSNADSFNLAGYTDWRLPTIKELYSLIMFSGKDVSGWEGSEDGLTPFINTDYFDFGYGDVDAGERIIDAQMASSTMYVSTTMSGNETMFGVNFADGRIKGYPIDVNGNVKTFYVYYVRGTSSYAINDFKDNSDGTITDNATGLMWTQQDNGEGLDWQDALNWAQEMNDENYLGYNDWRVPNAKELQSIIDYTRSPLTTNSAAIDPLFECSVITDEGGSDNYPFYWSSTTHENMLRGDHAVYVCFGEALGWLEDMMGNYHLLDVHGAGAQRSDSKSGDPDDYPYGHGPQGDVVRIYNYVRLVRDAENPTTGIDETNNVPAEFRLDQNYPNPFNPSTIISYQIPSQNHVVLQVYNLLGERVSELVNEVKDAGTYSVEFNAGSLPSGLYFYSFQADEFAKVKKMLFVK